MLHFYNCICICVGTDKPTVKLLNNFVRDKVAPRWYDLGVQLLNEVQREMLNIIDKNNRHDVQECCTKMFDHWLNVDIGANWNKLIEALKMIGENALARKIKANILKGIIYVHMYKCVCIANTL